MQQNYSKIGGILSIVSGGLGCLSSLLVVFLAVIIGFSAGGTYYYDGYYEPDQIFMILMVIYGVCGVIGIILSALAITGGIFALKKKSWGLALAGSIAGVLTFMPCGIVAVIFTVMSKPEFNTAPGLQTV
jgi:hypothetical protein